MRGRSAASAALCAVWLSGAIAARAAPPQARASIEGTWVSNFVLVMEAPKGTPQLVVSGAEAKAIGAAEAKALSDEFAKLLDPEVPDDMTRIDGLPIVKGQRRTRLLIDPADGKLPYTAQARKDLDAPAPPEKSDNPEDRYNGERCLVGEGQPPLSSFAFEQGLQILRAPGAVVIHTEYGDDLRIVPLTDKHRPKVLWGLLGDSIGHWEGKTLVVETVGQPEADNYRLAPTFIVSGEATVIERFTAVSNRELLYKFTVIDPKTYTRPWTAEFSWYRTDKPMREHACHEGNYSLANILSGARHEEAEKAAAAGK
ncbi:hypothetical protein [Phenylobacterium sp.]|uniref:hypothetical protein n=1 Tax=Phenylobacterium sp. TaxID=1871053 RepID=UPI002F3E2F7B